jgi:hypothetical protein
MGDRRQIEFTDMHIWFYTHWGGSTLFKDLQKAIAAAKPRWGDDPYCLRIIVSQIIGKEWNEETGYGLSNYSTDSEYTDFQVDIKAQTVKLGDKKWSFTEFLAADSSIDKEEDEEDEN